MELRQVKKHPFTLLAVSPNLKYGVAHGGRLIDLQSWKVLYTWDICVLMATFTPDSKLAIISRDYEDPTYVYSTDTGDMVSRLDRGGVCIATSLERIVKCSLDSVFVWDIGDIGEPRYRLQGHTANINHVVITNDGNHAITCSWDQTVRVWDLIKMRELRCLRGHQRTVNLVIQDNTRLISFDQSGHIIFWDMDTGALLDRLYIPHWIRNAVVIPGGLYMVASSFEDEVVIVDLTTKTAHVVLENCWCITMGVFDEATYEYWFTQDTIDAFLGPGSHWGAQL